nr:prepilin-type N-terminal cleavage/methylation domain-containing protein [uncultured Desulfobulbus sp.]
MFSKQVCRNGFTLLEVMIAVAIIAIAVVSLLGAQSQSVSIAGSAKFDTRASMLAQWKMADLMLQPYGELSDDSGNFGEDYPEYRWKLHVTEPTEDETGLSGTNGQIKTLDIEVHSTLESEQAYSLRTFVADIVRGKKAQAEGAPQPQEQQTNE